MTFSLLNALSVALSMVLSGVAGRRVSVILVLAIASPSALAVALVAVILVNPQWSPLGLTLGGVAGVLGGLGLLASFRAFSIGPAGVVGAVVASTQTVLVAVWGFVSERTAPLLGVIGLVVAVGAIALVTMEKQTGRVQPAAVLFATLAGINAAAFAILMSYTPSDDGWGPLLAVRAGVFVVALIFVIPKALTLGRPAVVAGARSAWLPAVATGVFDALGNVFLILAVRLIELNLIAVVAASTPALVALLGRIFLREKLARQQLLGIGLAVSAIVLTALPSL